MQEVVEHTFRQFFHEFRFGWFPGVGDLLQSYVIDRVGLMEDSLEEGIMSAGHFDRQYLGIGKDCPQNPSDRTCSEYTSPHITPRKPSRVRCVGCGAKELWALECCYCHILYTMNIRICYILLIEGTIAISVS